MSAMSRNSASPKPRVVPAGEPTRMPLVLTGGSGSNGTPFLLQVMPARSRLSSASLPVRPERTKVDERQVGVGAAGDEVGAALLEPIGERLGVRDDALRVGLELGLQRFVEGDRLGRDDVHQGSALKAREDRRVDLLGDGFVVGQDHAAARAAQGLVGGRGDDMGVAERASDVRPRRPGRRNAPCRRTGARRLRRRWRGSGRNRNDADRPSRRR